MSRRHLSYAIVAIAVVAAIGGDARALLAGDGPVAHGKSAPPLPATVLVPPRVTIDSLRGRPAAIDFWASWCRPCRQEAPGLAQLFRDLRGRASLVGVDWKDKPHAARAFINEYGWTFPILRASGKTLAGSYGVVGLPATIILNRAGRIAEVLRGPQTANEVKRALGIHSDKPRSTVVGVDR